MVPGIAVVPLLAETPGYLVHSGGVLFTSLEGLRDALPKHLSGVVPAAGLMTCGHTESPDALVFESPTFRLTTEPFQQVGLFEIVPSDWVLGERSACLGTLSFPAVTTVRTVTSPFAPLTGLLNSTDPTLGVARLAQTKFSEAMALAGEEWFEDGIESAFSRRLSTLVHTYGDAGIAAIETFLISPSANIETAVEAAQSLGEIDHPTTFRYRRTLLQKVVLKASAARLRHGAAAGLATMNDPSSIPTLTEARDRETNRRLRHFLELVLAQLERKRACGG